jgi:hypothetical protein
LPKIWIRKQKRQAARYRRCKIEQVVSYTQWLEMIDSNHNSKWRRTSNGLMKKCLFSRTKNKKKKMAVMEHVKLYQMKLWNDLFLNLKTFTFEILKLFWKKSDWFTILKFIN